VTFQQRACCVEQKALFTIFDVSYGLEDICNDDILSTLHLILETLKVSVFYMEKAGQV
jgi:hypothetical protein